ncbi:sensor domain-containing protein [Solimonas variicoloris]|uniref:sensor domain-containing protein n=1 Tax=Solimonas variicoloris TaxID=254408 RepID=UPI00036E2264|nr:diguanylate cyclase [Solimonas variicoloris]
MRTIDAGKRWPRRQAAYGLLLLQAVLLLALGLSCLAYAGGLQARAARALAEAAVPDALRAELRRTRHSTAELGRLARALTVRGSEGAYRWGLCRLAIFDADGLRLARAGRYDGLKLSGHVGAALEELLYRVRAVHASALVQTEDGRVLGRAEFDLIPSEAAAIHDDAVARLRATGYALLLLGGLLIPVWWRLLRRQARRPEWMRRADPHAPGSAGAMIDASTAAELFRERAGTVMDALDYGMVTADRDGRIRYLNATAERLSGWPLAAARGRMAYSVFHLHDRRDLPLQSALEQALQRNGDVPAQSAWLRARDGTRRPVELLACLIRKRDGSVDGVAMLCRDVTRHAAELDALKHEAQLSQAVVDHLEEGVLMTDPSGVVRFANARAERMFGYARDELQGFTITKLMPVPFLNTPGIRITDYVGTVGPRSDAALPKIVGWRKDATTFPVEIWVQPLQVEQSSGLVVIVRDISERLRGENLASRLGRLLDAAVEEVYIFDAQTLALLDVNRGARRNLGFRPEALLRMTPLDISEQLDEAVFRQYLLQLRGGEHDHLIYRCRHRRADGSSYPVEVRLNFSRDEEPPVFMAIAVDISERLEAELRLQQLAHYDALTGLPNRAMLQDRLQQAWLAAQQRGARSLGVLFLDLDRFKEINDRHGHEAGDLVLKATADRLRTALRESDTVARLAGDEFVIVAPGLRSVEDAAQLAQKLLDRFAHPLDIPGHRIQMRLSIGVTLYPLDESDAEGLLRHADAAMYEAKQAGRGCYRIFSTEIDADRRRRLGLEREIHAAVALNQLHLLMEPVLDVEHGAVKAIRASLYWQHPRFGRIAHDELLRAAARAGLIGDLELWQITHACEHHLSARRHGLPALPFIIDVSGWQLRSGEFACHVDELVRRYDVAADRLILALNPDGVLDAATLHADAAALIGRGLRLALRDFNLPLPDFGPLPIRLLLASDTLADTADMAAATAVARARGLLLIAMQVDEIQHARWRAAGCHWFGGEAVHAPMEAADAVGWLNGREVQPL